MNAAEAAKILTLAAEVDGRQWTKETAQLWALTLHDVSYQDAHDYLPEFFREHTGIGIERLMPAHIVAGVTDMHTKRVWDAGHEAFAKALEEGYSRADAVKLANAAKERALAVSPLAITAVPEPKVDWL